MNRKDFDTQRGIHGTPTAEREFPQQNERVPLVINEYWYADQQMIVRFTSIETDDFCNVETIENATLWD